MLEIVTRKAWRSMPAQWPIPDMEVPASAVWVFYTGLGQCHSRQECDPKVRELQRYHIEEKDGWNPDIPYSFMVGHDGRVYEGRGWGISVPEPQDRPDLYRKRYIIGYIGDDFEQQQDHVAVKAVEELIVYGIKNNYIKEDYEDYQWDMS